MSEDELVGLRSRGELLEVGAHLVGRADRRISHHVGDIAALRRGEKDVDLVVAVLRGRWPAGEHAAHPGAAGCLELLLGIRFIIGRDDVGRNDEVRRCELLRRSEFAAVERDGFVQCVGCKVRREGVGQAERRGEPGAE